MIDLSDLVLVFFDARHPEPGAMRDTLEHLVRRSLKRHDATKFLYILNQIDITAREDNPEDVVAAWQRALAEFGLTAGRFFCIYNPDVEAHFHDSATQKRFEDKRDADLAEIKQRIYQVEVERSYRLVGVLEKNASFIESTLVPTLETALRRWRKLVLIVDGFAVGIPFLAMLVLSIVWGWWHGLRFAPPWWDAVAGNPVLRFGLIAALLGALGFVHFKVRAIIADRVKRDLARGSWRDHTLANLAGAFVRSTRWWRSIFLKRPAGWTQGARRRLTQVTDSAHVYVQSLNDHFTNPTG
jgi:hypothetical protein